MYYYYVVLPYDFDEIVKLNVIKCLITTNSLNLYSW